MKDLNKFLSQAEDMQIEEIKDKKEEKINYPQNAYWNPKNERLSNSAIKRNTSSDTRMRTGTFGVRKGDEDVPVIWLQWTHFQDKARTSAKKELKKIYLTTMETIFLFHQSGKCIIYLAQSHPHPILWACNHETNMFFVLKKCITYVE